MSEKRFSHEVVSVEYLPTVNPKRFSHEVVSVEYLPTVNPKRFSHIVASVEVEQLLFPIFGRGRAGKPNEAFTPAIFGYYYLDPSDPRSDEHAQVDIVPHGLFAGVDEVPPAWDTVAANAVFTEIYAVTRGRLIRFASNGGLDLVIRPTDADPDDPLYDPSHPFDGKEFLYVHIVPNLSIVNESIVNAGDLIGHFRNYTTDSRMGGVTHLHFGVRGIYSQVYEDPRPYLVNGLIESP